LVKREDFKNQEEVTWCPGCGNFSIRETLKKTLTDLSLKPEEVVLVTGIGQAAKMPHYLRVNGFNGLHGRALPAGVALAAVRKDLKVIVESGDGDTYGEGGNHFLHNLRRNPDLAHFVHNNQIYGLTKGQASPTSEKGMQTGVQRKGVTHLPFNPILQAIVGGATFVARSFSGDPQHLEEMMKKAIEHKGYALLDILQPCVSFNKLNTFKWYKDRVYYIDEKHDPRDWEKAVLKASEWGEKIPLGLFYQEDREIFAEEFPVLKREEIFSPPERVMGWNRLLEEFK